MAATEVWYASPDRQQDRNVLAYKRVSYGATDALEMLRVAEKEIRSRHANPQPDSGRILILVDEPARLFAEEPHGLLLRQMAHWLTRNGRQGGVVLELRW